VSNFVKKRKYARWQFYVVFALIAILGLAFFITQSGIFTKPHYAELEKYNITCSYYAPPRWIPGRLGDFYRRYISRLKSVRFDHCERIYAEDQAKIDEFLRTLAQEKHLESLYITKDSAFRVEEDIAHIAKISSLEVLVTRALDDEGMAQLSKLPKLWSLNISDTGVGKSGLAHLSQMNRLEALDLENLRVDDKSLQHLAGMQQLSFLNLDHTDVTDVGLQQLSGLTSLAFLSLKHTAVIGTGLISLRKLPLVQIMLGDSKLSDEGLAAIGQIKSLQTLSINATDISDAGMTHLTNLPMLMFLNAEDTRITDSGLEQIKKIKSLGALHLGGCPISNNGMRHLAEMKRLCDLHIFKCDITAEGLEQLGSHPGKIYVQGTSIDVEEARRIQRKYPQIDILLPK